ncbi:MAG: NAD(+)/NADH kinase [Pseudomonadota bacterium]
MSANRLGIIVNPMSGRDVRRVAARASTSTHENKQQQVTRLVLGAFANGVDEIFLVNEPFRISARAIENLPQFHQVTMLDIPLTHTASDSIAAARAMWERGCRTFIVLGGDGTNRVVADALPGARLLPLSTGTNNVFPFMVEASVAGAAAGIVASGRVDVATVCPPCKRVHVRVNNLTETALVDAVLLQDDIRGSLLPFAPDKITHLFLARAEPASIGMSPIGGYILPCHDNDNFGLLIETGIPARYQVTAPVSAGLYGDILIKSIRQVPLDETVVFDGTGILGFDGDRLLTADQDRIEVTFRRDGPAIINPAGVMEAAVAAGAFTRN